jgi:RNA polymerase sigma-70 factor (ECF subfamily)
MGRAVDWKTTSTVLERLAASEDGRAWASLLTRFRGPILHLAQQMGLVPQDAEDVVQETLTAFVAGFRNGEYDRSKGRLSSWLLGIASHQIVAARRKLAIRNAHLKTGKGTSFWNVQPAATPETELWAKEWERAILREYLAQVRAKVTPTTFKAFEMIVWAQRSPAEAAAELGISIKTVYNAKHRVLTRIRELQEEHENAIIAGAARALS